MANDKSMTRVMDLNQLSRPFIGPNTHYASHERPLLIHLPHGNTILTWIFQAYSIHVYQFQSLYTHTLRVAVHGGSGHGSPVLQTLAPTQRRNKCEILGIILNCPSPNVCMEPRPSDSPIAPDRMFGSAMCILFRQLAALHAPFSAFLVWVSLLSVSYSNPLAHPCMHPSTP